MGLAKLGKKMVLLVEILMDIAPKMFVVEVKVVDNIGCCGTLSELEGGDWEELQMGLGDIVLSWYNNDVLSCEKKMIN